MRLKLVKEKLKSRRQKKKTWKRGSPRYYMFELVLFPFILLLQDSNIWNLHEVASEV